ncbi:MAG: hypothetical protein AB1Z98_04565 [Nannocystaceae bacterium]
MARLPDACPDRDCPPEGARPCNGMVFRLAKAAPPEADDFLTAAEQGKHRRADACLRCGLSVFVSRDAAEHLRDLYPKLGTFIARAHLDEGRGKLEQTNRPPHHTWWPNEEVPRHQGFEVK